MGNRSSSDTSRKAERTCFGCVQSSENDDDGDAEYAGAAGDASSSPRTAKCGMDDRVLVNQVTTSSEAKRDSKSEVVPEGLSGCDSKTQLLSTPCPSKKVSDCSYDRDAQSCLTEDAGRRPLPLPEETLSMLCGKPEPGFLLSHKDISVFVMSAGEDTTVERQELLARVLPQLKNHCKREGCRMIGLNVNKLGEHRNISAYTHRQLCLRVFSAIREASNVVLIMLIRDDPGTILLPETMEINHFDAAREGLDPENRSKLEECYFRSGASYLLLKKEGVSSNDGLLSALKGVWDEGTAKRYLRSVFEEVVERMLGCGPSGLKSTICLKVRPVGRTPDEMRDAEIHHERLAALDAKIQEAVDESNILQVTVKLKNGIVDPEYPSHSQYLDDVCARTMPILTSIVDCDIMPYTQVDPLPFGIDRWIATELKQGSYILKALSKKQFFREAQLEEFKRSLETHSNGQAVVVHGEPGCGKTTFLVSVINSLRLWFPGSAVVYRFGAMTPQTRISSNLFRSIVLHLSYFMEETAHEQYRKYPSKERLRSMLVKLPADSTFFVIIDAVDQVDAVASDVLEWLPLTDLPSNVKIIISVDSSTDAFSRMKAVVDKRCLYELKSLSASELVAAAKENMLRENHYMPNASELEQMHNCLSSIQTLCGVQLLTKLSCTGSLQDLPLTMDGLLRKMRDELEDCLGLSKVLEVLFAIGTTHQGLAAEEFEEFFTNDSEGANEDGLPNFDGAWLNVLFSIMPFLHTLNVGGVSMYTYTSNHFRRMVLALGNEPESQNALVSTQQALKKRLQETLSAMDGRDKSHAFEEVPYLAHQLGENLDEYTFGMNWLFEKICKCGVTEVENDLSLAMSCAKHHCDDMKLLFSTLQLSGHALNTDPGQFFTQIHSRLQPLFDQEDFSKNYPKLSALLQRIEEFPMPSLIPLGPCLDTPKLIPTEFSDEFGWLKLDSKLFLVSTDPGYVISLSAARGEVAVWNCLTNECVRSMQDLQEPKTLRVLPGKRQAICLCGRELILIDLAEAKVERKIKGIMNQKLPLYALVDELHLISLARNRMYLNLIHIESGDCISTFKVGEDRFLNSLVVSDNGKICVCGDETQKPFPLLVWDLEKRKLVFDLRIPHHEFLTQLMSITKEGHYVACACEEIDGNDPMFIVVYDLQNGTQFKRLKPGKPLVALAISSPRAYPQPSLASPSRTPHSTLLTLLAGSGGRSPSLVSPMSGTPPLLPLSGATTPTPGGPQFQEQRDPHVIASRADGSVLVWDLVTGSLKWTLRGHTIGPDVLRVDDNGEKLFTYDSTGVDPTLRLWSLSSGTLIASFTPDDPFVDSCRTTLGSKTVIYAASQAANPEQSQDHDGNIVTLVLGHGPNWKDDLPLIADFGDALSHDVIDIHFALPGDS